MRRTIRAAGARPRAVVPAADAGFTLIEVIMAVTVIGVVMAALGTFFVSTASATNRQTGRQAAIQLTDDAGERLRALRGSAVASGRDKGSSDTQWNNPVAGVSPYLAGMQEAWDPNAAAGAGASAPLPTATQSATVNGLTFGQNWYVGKCWQPQAGGDCDATAAAGYVEFFRVVLAVTWSEQHCPNGICSYVSSTLVSDGSEDPVFNANQNAQPPTVDNPGSQVGEVSAPVSLQLTSSGGAPPVTWTGSGLPSGLSVASNGLISGTPTVAGTYSVTVSATDGFSLVGTAALTWTIGAQPVVASPGNRTTSVGTAVSLPLQVNGGTAPMTWSATGLPAGLSVNASTGLVTGTATTAGPATSVTANVTDRYGASASTTFSWTITTLKIQTPAAVAGGVGGTVSMQVAVSGGVTPYTWSATGLPPGLAIGSTGVIAGTLTTAGSYQATVTVSDATGVAVSTTPFGWTVGAAPTVTAPTGTRNDTVGTAVSVQSTATGGTGAYTWSATNLPPGLAIDSSTGRITGTPSAGTRYVTTVTVTDAAGGSDSDTVIWNVANSSGLRITSPTADRPNDTVGQSVTITPQTAGGNGLGGYSWTVTGLPPGMTASNGTISGTLTAAGTYVVTMTVLKGSQATFMFTWTVQ
jgi:prepilin-type N-terminal cleavage/methylation domain-containing protein